MSGTGIHGPSAAWGLAERLNDHRAPGEGRILVGDTGDKDGIGASGFACAVVRDNDVRPARPRAHPVAVRESDPEAASRC